MNATELYKLTIEDYKCVLGLKDITLRNFCKQKHVCYNGIQNWMWRNSIRVAELREKCRSTGLPKEEHPVGHSIYPLIIQPSHSLAKSMAPCLKGVNITFPDGVIVTIKEITREDLSMFIQTHLAL